MSPPRHPRHRWCPPWTPGAPGALPCAAFAVAAVTAPTLRARTHRPVRRGATHKYRRKPRVGKLLGLLFTEGQTCTCTCTRGVVARASGRRLPATCRPCDGGSVEPVGAVHCRRRHSQPPMIGGVADTLPALAPPDPDQVPIPLVTEHPPHSSAAGRTRLPVSIQDAPRLQHAERCHQPGADGGRDVEAARAGGQRAQWRAWGGHHRRSWHQDTQTSRARGRDHHHHGLPSLAHPLLSEASDTSLLMPTKLRRARAQGGGTHRHG